MFGCVFWTNYRRYRGVSGVVWIVIVYSTQKLTFGTCQKVLTQWKTSLFHKSHFLRKFVFNTDTPVKTNWKTVRDRASKPCPKLNLPHVYPLGGNLRRYARTGTAGSLLRGSFFSLKVLSLVVLSQHAFENMALQGLVSDVHGIPDFEKNQQLVVCLTCSSQKTIARNLLHGLVKNVGLSKQNNLKQTGRKLDHPTVS